MSFGGGGGGALPNHEHTNIALDGGPLDFVNTTIASLSASSMTYSDGAALQELTIGSDAQVLSIQGGAPSWITNTSNPLVKVSKTFSDISGGSIDIYTLPEDSAICNVWADITTAFDISTAVTIGDAVDPDGFAEATDWTAGTGLTAATRGDYITSFKNMLSTSGTTAIKAYNFSTTSANTFTQSSGGSARAITNGGTREELAQQFNAGHVLIGENINSVSWWIKLDSGSPSGLIQAFIRQSDGTLIETSSTTVDASTVGAEVEYSFTFAGTYALQVDDMITVSLDNGNGPPNYVSCDTDTASMTDGTLWQTATTGSGYTEIVTTQMKMTVGYGTLNTDTQGAIDFYLQVVN